MPKMPPDRNEPSPKKQIFSQFAIIGKALSHGHRLEILEHLAQGERSVEVLANIIGLSVANASQHLQHLRRAGLVNSRRAGQQNFYSLTDENVINLLSNMQVIAESNLVEVEKLITLHYKSQDPLEAVSRTELLSRLKKGDAIVVDVRPQNEFDAGHVSGALNFPLGDLEKSLKKLPKRLTIVAYCRGPYCALAHQAIAKLRKKGYDARRLEGGFPEWKSAGLPVEQVS